MITRVLLHACLLMFGPFMLLGCQKRTPVQEITPSTAKVSVTERDLSQLEAQWPMWRGPQQSGVVIKQKIPTEWSETENIKWRVPVPGRGHSSPVIVNDWLFLATALEDSEKQQVLAYDAASGELLWQQTVHEKGFPPRGQMHSKSTYANGTVACDGERVYVAFLNDAQIHVTALAFDSGEILWSKSLGAFNAKFGYAPSPLLYKSLIILAADNRGGGYLAAVDQQTGEIAWRIERPAISTYSSPRVVSLGGKDQLLISGCQKVCSYDPMTGEQYWQTDGTAEATCGTVVVADDRLYASGGYPQQQTIALDAQGNQVWSNRTKIYEPSMIVVNEALFAITDGGIAYCWGLEEGTEYWKSRLGGNFSASPLAVDDRIYVSNLEGSTFVFQATTNGYQELAVNQLGSDCYASPAVYQHQLYLRIGVGSGGSRKEELVCIAFPESVSDTAGSESVIGETP